MEASKRRRLTAAGWRVGSTREFLGMSPAEAALIEMRLRLARNLRQARRRRHLTQSGLARRLGSSQSRVAKIESADPSVSLDLLVNALLALGTTPRALGKIIASRQPVRAA